LQIMFNARTTTTTRRRLTHGSNLCECPTCGEQFLAPHGFDKHRVGPMDQRRCLTPDEMARRGLRRNERDWWVTR
jgi:hypothetical protein